jgi:hypothetical protein
MSKDAEKYSDRTDRQVMDAPMPNIYAGKPVSNTIAIEFVEPSTDESSGFNPYDTASLFKK